MYDISAHNDEDKNVISEQGEQAYIHRKRSTTTITFRLESNTLKTLQTEAKESGISLNILVNQILNRYVEWDVFESNVGMVSVAKPVMAKVFAKMTKDEVIDLATRKGNSAVHDIVLFMKGDLSVYVFLSWLEARMRNCSQVNHQQENDVEKYIFKHDLGENWSLYHKTIAELIFGTLNSVINVEISNTMLVFTLPKL
jgi:hypothetical protein